MKNMKTLTSLDIGQTAIVNYLLIKGSMRRRLQDIGLIHGTKVECVLKSPGNDPIAYKIRGAIIALRNEDTDGIIIY